MTTQPRNTKSPKVDMSRLWFFTYNNYTEEHIKKITQLHRYIFQEEKGESGTPHLQGYIEMKNACRMSALKKKTGDGIHLELPRNIYACQNYCQKLNSRNGKIYCNHDKWMKKENIDAQDPMSLLFKTDFDAWLKKHMDELEWDLEDVIAGARLIKNVKQKWKLEGFGSDGGEDDDD